VEELRKPDGQGDFAARTKFDPFVNPIETNYLANTNAIKLLSLPPP
jgi:hypothetical protein